MSGPSGTVTFLFTDIEGSTRLWQQDEVAMRAALSRHDELLRETVAEHDGVVFSSMGDGLAAAFASASGAVAAALAAQRLLEAEAWATATPVRVRMGLHTGEAEVRDGDYFGTAVNRTARLMAVGHGGQVLCSGSTASVVGDGGATLVDLGEHRLRDLDRPVHVFQVGSGSFGALRSLDAVPSNLPMDRSVFVGRAQELGVVAGLVRSARVVTLTGVGGVGKTRLAVKVAAGMVDEFPDGVWLVELAPLIDAALVPAAVGSAIGAQPSSGVETTEALCQFLAQRRALLVLDNCEHVVNVAAELVDRLLGASPRLRVLATSREPLGVQGESVWRVPSLSVDAGTGEVSDAVALFAERAAQVRPGFELDDETAALTMQVCRRLDGIPLAIELAAARAKVMSVQQIGARLDERFRLLTRGGRTAVARQQTLQGAIDWSYELLAPDERALFDLLGVFAGDFDLKAAAAVSGRDDFEVLDLLDQLADRSMVEPDPSRDRYRLLETLRQYAWDRLVATGRLSEAREAHASHFFLFSREQGALMAAPGAQLGALDRLEADYDNVRAALAYLIERRDTDRAARMVRRLVGLFNIRHPREGLAWFEQVIAIADELPAKTRSRLLGDAASAAMNAGSSNAQGQYARLSIELGGDDAPAMAYTELSMWHLAQGETTKSLDAARKAVTAATRTHNVPTQMQARISLIVALGAAGAEADIRPEIPILLQLAETLASPTLSVAAYFGSGEAYELVGNTDEALALFRAGLAISDLAGPEMRAQARLFCALLIDDLQETSEMLRQALAIGRDELSYVAQATALVSAAKYALDTGAAIDAAQLVGAWRHHARLYGGFAQPLRWRWSQRLLEQLSRTLGPAALDEEVARGAKLSVEAALELASNVATHAAR
jgi:predicted ATPase/class 3 adenylate cyclase